MLVGYLKEFTERQWSNYTCLSLSLSIVFSYLFLKKSIVGNNVEKPSQGGLNLGKFGDCKQARLFPHAHW